MLPIASIAIPVCSCQRAPEQITYTTISATLNEPVAMVDTVFYPKQIYRYPQLRNMDNTVAQDSLNRLFKLADFDALQADTQYSGVQRLDNEAAPEHDYMYSFEWIRVSYLSDELISYSGMTEYSGGAHPSYELRKARTVALSTLQPIPLEEMFVGDYKTFFREQAAASKQLAGFASNDTVEYDELGSACGDILDALLLHINAMTTSENMLVSDTTLSILQADFRDFGCPEVMRGVVEVRIPYRTLAPYVNPKGPLRQFLRR
ncbi:MAG: DUF4163 domain-containing protein [Prevotellaceae bacterium]|jgi:hypothetical protein|nr:DUF4163 domain-containing protein [Prevotellaceae bacterium]